MNQINMMLILKPILWGQRNCSSEADKVLLDADTLGYELETCSDSAILPICFCKFNSVCSFYRGWYINIISIVRYLSGQLLQPNAIFYTDRAEIHVYPVNIIALIYIYPFLTSNICKRTCYTASWSWIYCWPRWHRELTLQTHCLLLQYPVFIWRSRYFRYSYKQQFHIKGE